MCSWPHAGPEPFRVAFIILFLLRGYLGLLVFDLILSLSPSVYPVLMTVSLTLFEMGFSLLHSYRVLLELLRAEDLTAKVDELGLIGRSWKRKRKRYDFDGHGSAGRRLLHRSRSYAYSKLWEKGAHTLTKAVPS